MGVHADAVPVSPAFVQAELCREEGAGASACLRSGGEWMMVRKGGRIESSRVGGRSVPLWFWGTDGYSEVSI